MQYTMKLDLKIRSMPGLQAAVENALKDAGCYQKEVIGFREIFYCKEKPKVSPIYCVEFEEKVKAHNDWELTRFAV